MDGAAIGRPGISVNGSSRHDHQRRSASAAQWFAGGGRGKSGLFKCPADTPPAPGKHCDSVPGSTSHGDGVLPQPTEDAPARPKS
jgi:hypothetical protein